jgi:hypothetical protein
MFDLLKHFPINFCQSDTKSNGHIPGGSSGAVPTSLVGETCHTQCAFWGNS